MGKKKSLKMKIFLVTSAVLIVGLVVGVIVFLASINSIAKMAIEKVLSSVLQVEVTLDSAKVSLLSGKVELHKLRIGNPEGFKTPEAFSAEQIRVKVNLKSFRTDQPIVELVSINNPKVSVEQRFTSSNITQLIKNASRFEGEKTENQPEETQKRVRVDRIIVNRAHIVLTSSALLKQEIGFTLPRIVINNLGGEKTHLTIARAVALFFTEILRTTLSEGDKLLPEEINQALRISLDSAVENIRRIPELKIEEITTIGEEVKEAGKALKDDVKESIKGVKGLFKRGKRKEKK